MLHIYTVRHIICRYRTPTTRTRCSCYHKDPNLTRIQGNVSLVTCGHCQFWINARNIFSNYSRITLRDELVGPIDLSTSPFAFRAGLPSEPRILTSLLSVYTRRISIVRPPASSYTYVRRLYISCNDIFLRIAYIIIIT